MGGGEVEEEVDEEDSGDREGGLDRGRRPARQGVCRGVELGGEIERGRLPAWIRGGADGPPRIEEGQTARLG